MTGISIIICCYNSARRLPKTLAFLGKQEVDASLPWEIVLVDNNSTDGTAEVAISLWEPKNDSVPLRVVKESQAGLSYAREAGMKAATYDLFLWCDDDNWLCDNYVQTAYDVMATHPEIGALGGWCDAAFESEKPKWFDEQARYFAVSKQGKQSGDITYKKGCVYGAGMVLRKSHWEQLRMYGFKQLLSDRVGTKLSSGGDTEYCYALRLLGYKIWFDERLYFTHYMTTARLELDYVKRIRQSMVYSNFILWPYLDMLENKRQTPSDFHKAALKRFPALPLRKLGALLFGSFEQKAAARRYFKNLYYRLFNYSIYNNHYQLIESWCPTKRDIESTTKL